MSDLSREGWSVWGEFPSSPRNLPNSQTYKDKYFSGLLFGGPDQRLECSNLLSLFSILWENLGKIPQLRHQVPILVANSNSSKWFSLSVSLSVTE